MREITPEESGLGPEIASYYTHLGMLPDGTICGVHRLMYHWTMHVGVTEVGYEDRWCFATEVMAYAAMLEWDGDGEPCLWHKHPKTGRYRDVHTGEVWFEWEPRVTQATGGGGDARHSD